MWKEVKTTVDERTEQGRLSPLKGVYSFVEPAEFVQLYDGELTIGDLTAQGRIWAHMSADLRIQWELDGEIDFPGVDLGESQMRIEQTPYGPVDVPITPSNSDGRGTVGSADMSTGARLARVTVHWVNLPAIYPSDHGLQAASITWAGRWVGEGGGWRITLDSRPDLPRVSEAMRETDDFAITHVGELARADGTEFTAEEAAEVLYGWQTGLSFAVGRWVPPAFPVGHDAAGDIAWEAWAPWRCDPAESRLSWWDSQNGSGLKEFLRGFLDHWCDPARQPVVRYVAHHAIAANHSGTTLEARIMLAQAAIEYFSWVTHVLAGRQTRSQHDKLGAGGRLRQLLKEAGIPSSVPVELDAIGRFAAEQGCRDVAEALPKIRNLLVHPKDAAEPYQIKFLLSQAWCLSLQYVELLLLHHIGYAGGYTPRFPPHRFAHDRIPVPWA